MTQFLMAMFGLTSIYCAMSCHARLRKFAPIIGLAGQPCWFWFAWQSQAWGMGALVLAYTLVYIRGAWVQWGNSDEN